MFVIRFSSLYQVVFLNCFNYMTTVKNPQVRFFMILSIAKDTVKFQKINALRRYGKLRLYYRYRNSCVSQLGHRPIAIVFVFGGYIRGADPPVFRQATAPFPAVLISDAGKLLALCLQKRNNVGLVRPVYLFLGVIHGWYLASMIELFTVFRYNETEKLGVEGKNKWENFILTQQNCVGLMGVAPCFWNNTNDIHLCNPLCRCQDKTIWFRLIFNRLDLHTVKLRIRRHYKTIRSSLLFNPLEFEVFKIWIM